MLIFVSDLHLADDTRRTTLDAAALLRAVKAQLDHAEAAGLGIPTLVLLGDIFELLKSDVWRNQACRPWDQPSPALDDVVAQIMKRVIDANPTFFATLRVWSGEKRLNLLYLPGNHDGVLADSVGGKARALLRSVLPLPGASEEPFGDPFEDLEHGVYAEHGHEFDEFNRRKASRDRFVVGDAIVIELLAHLPVEAATALGMTGPEAQLDESLRFLHELDNVRPQSLKGLMGWIDHAIGQQGVDKRLEIERRFLDALARCLTRLRAAMQFHGHYGAGEQGMLRAIELCLEKGSFAAVRQLKRLPNPSISELARVSERLDIYEAGPSAHAPSVDLIIAGHTHLPLNVPLPRTSGRVFTYLNTGTWRRVLALVEMPDGSLAFSSYDEEALVCVHRLQDVKRGLARYEFHRNVRGH